MRFDMKAQLWNAADKAEEIVGATSSLIVTAAIAGAGALGFAVLSASRAPGQGEAAAWGQGRKVGAHGGGR